MGLQFTPGAGVAQPQAQPEIQAEGATVTTATPTEAALDAKIEEVKNFNIMVKSDEIKQQLATSEEIDKLVSTINVNDPNTIVKFGAEAADQISAASDQVLNSMSIQQINDTGVMMKNLAAIMDQFDAKELEDKPGLFAKLKRNIEKILNKYDTMGKEIDKIAFVNLGYARQDLCSAERLRNRNRTGEHKARQYVRSEYRLLSAIVQVHSCGRTGR